MILSFLEEKIKTNPARRDKVILINALLALVFNVALWVLFLYYFHSASEYIVLKYNIYFGISDLGLWYYVLFLPLIGLLVLLINYFVALLIFLRNTYFSYLLSFSSSIVNLLLLIAGLFLIYKN
ncbi:MAG: hypothetical protein WCL61_00715 [bacterium]